MLDQAIAVINGKGGVGKTSIAGNLAGLAALAGYRVLAVDVDPQGNLGLDLGLDRLGLYDRGKSLCDAMMGGTPVKVLRNIRPNLDVICGGPEMDDLSDYLTNRRARGSSSYRALATLLQPFGSEYHLVVIDSPPGERMLQINALTAARCAVIPTKSDSRSLDGLEKVARLFSFVREGDDHMRELNPALAMLGVVVFGVGTASRAIRREAREKVARMFQDESVPFHTVPRHVEKIAVSTREHGLLVHEVEAETARRVADEDDPMSTASGLAADYEHLTAEILERWQAIRQPVAGAAGVTR